MPDGILSQAEMPPFSVMGLLLGGRGYASGWFQQRDRLQMADAAIAKDREDRATFAQGVLADPRWKQYVANPNDRQAAGNLWGLMYGGPESAAEMGNQLFTQGVGAIQGQELAALQQGYQLKQQQQAHEFRLLEQTHGSDEALRQQQLLDGQKLQVMSQAYDFVSKPLPDGMTAEQKQYAVNQAGDLAGIKRKEGYDLVASPSGGVLGQVPQRGTPERTKIEMVGNAYSNVSSLAAKHMFQLENGQVGSITEWNTETDLALNDMRKIYEAGSMTADDMRHFEEILPKLKLTSTDLVSPDLMGRKREQLMALKERMDRDLNQYAATTLVPVDTYTADDFAPPANYQPTEPPPQSDFNAERDRREQRLKELPPRNQGRVRPALEYEKKSSTGPGFSLPPAGKNPREYTVR